MTPDPASRYRATQHGRRRKVYPSTYREPAWTTVTGADGRAYPVPASPDRAAADASVDAGYRRMAADDAEEIEQRRAARRYRHGPSGRLYCQEDQ